MSKRIITTIVLALSIMITGCSTQNEENSKFGYVKGNKYVNKELKLSMEIPKDWVVNENIEKLNKETTNELTTIARMTNMSLEKATEELSYIHIVLLEQYKDAETYANEQFEFEFSDKDKNCKAKDTKKINGKDYIILEYKDASRYVTMTGDKVILFTTSYSNDTKLDIDKSIESIEFK